MSGIEYFGTTMVEVSGPDGNYWAPALAADVSPWWIAAEDPDSKDCIIGTPTDSDRSEGFPVPNGESLSPEEAKSRAQGWGDTLIDRQSMPYVSGTFKDDFNRADQNLEASADWTLVAGGSAGACKVQSNELAFNGGASNSTYLCPDQGDANHYTQFRYTGSASTDQSAQPFRAIVRATDASNFYGIRQEGADMRAYRWDGAQNLIGSTTYTWVGNDIWRIAAVGDAIEVFRNGVSVIGPITGQTHNQTVTRGGVHCRVTDQGTTRRQDDFEHGLVPYMMFLDISNARGSTSGNPYAISIAAGQGNIER